MKILVTVQQIFRIDQQMIEIEEGGEGKEEWLGQKIDKCSLKSRNRLRNRPMERPTWINDQILLQGLASCQYDY